VHWTGGGWSIGKNHLPGQGEENKGGCVSLMLCDSAEGTAYFMNQMNVQLDRIAAQDTPGGTQGSGFVIGGGPAGHRPDLSGTSCSYCKGNDLGSAAHLLAGGIQQAADFLDSHPSLAVVGAVGALAHDDSAPLEKEGQIIGDEAVTLSQKGLDLVRNHLAQFGEDEPNNAMMERLQKAFDAGQKVTGANANFYLHEASEATMMQQGLSYDAAHAAALQKYGVSNFSLYAPEVIKMYPTMFNIAGGRSGG
jgi:hypothetical protein